MARRSPLAGVVALLCWGSIVFGGVGRAQTVRLEPGINSTDLRGRGHDAGFKPTVVSEAIKAVTRRSNINHDKGEHGAKLWHITDSGEAFLAVHGCLRPAETQPTQAVGHLPASRGDATDATTGKSGLRTLYKGTQDATVVPDSTDEEAA